jgi:sugar fermentation stimulation protein A
MHYKEAVIEGKLVRRYMRFLADVIVEGRLFTVHCPNSGSMAGLTDEGNSVRISGPHARQRKYLYTLEQIQITRPDDRRIWVGINTLVPNIIVYEALKARRVPGMEDYRLIRREVKLGDHSRIDLRLEHPDLPLCWIEVKNVTLVVGNPTQKKPLNVGNIAAFPDAVTTRGTKHLRELMERVRLGERAIMLYVIQRSDGERFAAASGYDPEYAIKLDEAQKAGVEVLPMRARVTKSGIWLGEKCGRA